MVLYLGNEGKGGEGKETLPLHHIFWEIVMHSDRKGLHTNSLSMP